MDVADWLLIANVACTLFLVGLIWTVQWVHYPAFRWIEPSRFASFEAFHTRRITWVVAPPMILEALSALALVGWRPDWMPLWAAATGATLVVLIWVSTFAVQVPLHTRLARGWDEEAVETLILTNWVRTGLWTARGALMIWMILAGGGDG